MGLNAQTKKKIFFAKLGIWSFWAEIKDICQYSSNRITKHTNSSILLCSIIQKNLQSKKQLCELKSIPRRSQAIDWGAIKDIRQYSSNRITKHTNSSILLCSSIQKKIRSKKQLCELKSIPRRSQAIDFPQSGLESLKPVPKYPQWSN